MRTEHYGGSEISQIAAIDAKDGKAIGFDGKQFKQNLHV